MMAATEETFDDYDEYCNNYITLRSGSSSNYREFEVVRSSRYSCCFIDTILSGDSDINVIEIRGLWFHEDVHELQLIVNWLNHHHKEKNSTNPPQIDMDKAKQIINNKNYNREHRDSIHIINDLKTILDDEWDIDFIQSIMKYKHNKDILIYLMNSANFLDMPTFLTLIMFAYCLYYPFHIILQSKGYPVLFTNLWRYQCNFYDQYKLEQFAINTLSKMETITDKDKHSAFTEYVLFLVKEMNVYNYFIHKQLDMIVWYDNKYKDLQSIVDKERSNKNIINMDIMLIYGFIRDIDTYTTHIIPHPLIQLIQKNLTYMI